MVTTISQIKYIKYTEVYCRGTFYLTGWNICANLTIFRTLEEPVISSHFQSRLPTPRFLCTHNILCSLFNISISLIRLSGRGRVGNWNHLTPAGRCHWPRGLRRGCAAARLLRMWVWIPPKAWMSVPCECYELSDRVFCDGPISRPEKSFRVWLVWLWSQNHNIEEA